MSKKKNKDDLSTGNKHGKRTSPGPEKKPIYHHGSTTQGGSNFGQGSSNLGSDARRQGDIANSGSSYDGERWVSDDANSEPPPPPPGKK
jgi:hypothetical protein